MDAERVTVEEAAELAGRSVATIRRWAKSGRVRAIKIGKEWLIEAASVPRRAPVPPPRQGARQLDLLKALQQLRSEDFRNPWVPDILMWRDVLNNPDVAVANARAIVDGSRTIEPALSFEVPKTPFFTRNGQALPVPEALTYHSVVASFAERAEKRRRDCVFSARLSNNTDERLLQEGTSLWKEWAKHVVSLIRAGSDYMLSTDITAYYDCIPHSLLIAEVEAYSDDPSVVTLLRRMLNEWGTAQVGIPQGPDASRLLGNIYLYPIDEAMDGDSRWTYTRYMDDIRIVSPSRKGVFAAMRVLEQECKRRRLVLSAQKTELLIEQHAIDDFEDPTLNSAQFWIGRRNTARARRALRKILDKAIDKAGNVHVRRARFSLYRLWMSRDRQRVRRVIENLEHLGPVAKHAVTYLRPWIENPRARDLITEFLEDEDRNTSSFIETWLFAALVEHPGVVPVPWLRRARNVTQDGNAPEYLRVIAMNMVAREARPTDIVRLEQFAAKERNPSLARGALVALARAGKLRKAVAKEAVHRHAELEPTVRFLQGRNRLPSLIYADQTVPVAA